VQIIPLADPGGTYVNWSVFHISATNLVIIAVMVVVFGLALLVPFPRHDNDTEDDR
jgi:hypothetical protein